MYKFLVVLSTVITATTAAAEAKYNYTQISYTKSGKHCLNDCIHDVCIVDWAGNTEQCINTGEKAPKYFTTQRRSDREECLSNCNRFGYSYEWCYVTGDGTWDYCSSTTRISWIKKQYISKYYGPCLDTCELDGNTYQCTNFHGYKSECELREHSYVQSYNIYGNKCIGRCKKHNSYYNRYYWCEDANQKPVYCAPSAQPKLSEFFRDIPISCVNKIKRNKRCIANFNSNIIADMAKKIETSSYFETVKVNENRNPIYSYTVKIPLGSEEPILPLVIRANITMYTTTPILESKTYLNEEVTRNLNKMSSLAGDKPNYLIGKTLGGVEEVFNVIPQKLAFRKRLDKFVSEIHGWVKNEANTVDITIVIIYIHSTRPTAAGLDINFKINDKVVKKYADEIVNNIVPGEDLKLQEPTRNYDTTTKIDTFVNDVDFGIW